MKFCFFGDISGALTGQTPGGAELQISLLARALAIKGHEVVIIDPYAIESFVTSEGVKVLTVRNWNKGPKGVRLFLYRIPELWKILIKQNADYYYVRMRSYLYLIIYYACRRVGGKFIQAIAQDLDFAGHLQKFKYEYKRRFNIFKYLTVSLPNDIVLHFLLKYADYVILQHSGQAPAAHRVGQSIVTFPNIIDVGNIPVIKQPLKVDYIHVGSLQVLKGSEILYDLIQLINKNCRIIIVGQPVDKRSVKILKKLSKIDNVFLKGRLDHDETLRLIANSKALINTSIYEGFPNIFLEAWASGVPVVSLNVNPGDVFNKYQLGFYCNSNLQKMKEYIESNKIDNIKKENLISYIDEFHSFHDAGDRFMKILNNK